MEHLSQQEAVGCGEREVTCIVVFVMVLVKNKGR